MPRLPLTAAAPHEEAEHRKATAAAAGDRAESSGPADAESHLRDTAGR